jgi:hypothetical protein
MHQKRLQADVSGYRKIFMQGKGCLDSCGFVNEREKEVFKILNWIVRQNQPLNEIDNEITQDILHI